MEPSKPLTAATASSTPGLSAQHGVDMLWRHQLRKESAALLERLDASNKMIEDITSETDRKLQDAAERITTLEAQLSKIDSEGKKMKEAKQKWDDDVAALKMQMGIMASHASQAQVMSKEPEPSIILTPRPIEDESPSTTPRTATRLDSDTSTAASSGNLATTRAVTPDTIVPAIDNSAILNISTPVLRSRSRSKSNRPTPTSGHPAEPSQPVTLPRLIQGTSTLPTYYKNASTAFLALPKDRQVEVDFIGQFIKGMQEPRTRNVLADMLQKAHPCRTNKDGKVEILCEWADVAEGLTKAGMLAGEAGEGASQGAGRKRKKILIPREWIESGMMR